MMSNLDQLRALITSMDTQEQIQMLVESTFVIEPKEQSNTSTFISNLKLICADAVLQNNTDLVSKCRRVLLTAQQHLHFSCGTSIILSTMIGNVQDIGKNNPPEWFNEAERKRQLAESEREAKRKEEKEEKRKRKEEKRKRKEEEKEEKRKRKEEKRKTKEKEKEAKRKREEEKEEQRKKEQDVRDKQIKKRQKLEDFRWQQLFLAHAGLTKLQQMVEEASDEFVDE